MSGLNAGFTDLLGLDERISGVGFCLLGVSTRSSSGRGGGVNGLDFDVTFGLDFGFTVGVGTSSSGMLSAKTVGDLTKDLLSEGRLTGSPV